MLPPHPKKEHFLLKNAYYLMKDKVNYFFQQREEMGDIYTLTSPFRDVIVITNPLYIRQVLVDNNKNYGKSFAYEKVALLLGNGLLTSQGDFWRKQRRLIQPAFYKEKLVKISEMMIAETEMMLNSWEKYAGTEKYLDISFEMNKIALEIVSKSLFSSQLKGDMRELTYYITEVIKQGSERIDNPFLLPIWLPTPYNIHAKKCMKALDTIIYGMIAERHKSEQRHDDLLSMLMETQDEETGEKMSDKQLRDEIMTIFMAGNETSANALAWTWYLLAKNPEKLQILVDEIDTVLGTEKPTAEKLRTLPYLKQVLDESMRLMPPAWVMGRMAIAADKFGDYDIPAGFNIAIPIWVVHKDPAIWENAEAFIPERFAPENMKEKERFAFFPFGGGPRQCVGNNFAYMEMQIVMAMTLQKYSLSLKSDYVLEYNPLVTLRPKNPLMMQVRKR